MVAFQPVEDEPEIALEHRLPERVLDLLIALFFQEFLQKGQRALVGFLFEQVLRSSPQEGLQPILAISLAIRTRADEHGLVQTVPEVFGIGVIECRGRCHDSWWACRREKDGRRANRQGESEETESTRLMHRRSPSCQIV